jgi:hypothetical protein
MTENRYYTKVSHPHACCPEVLFSDFHTVIKRREKAEVEKIRR